MFKGSKIRLTAIRKEDLPTYRQWASEDHLADFILPPLFVKNPRKMQTN